MEKTNPVVLTNYGYCINDTVEFRIKTAVLVNLTNGTNVRLRSTMARLLTFILAKGNGVTIKDDDIMKVVFEDNGLRCSRPRLWQAINALNCMLRKVGVGGEFICRTRDKSYLLKARTRSLFCANDF